MTVSFPKPRPATVGRGWKPWREERGSAGWKLATRFPRPHHSLTPQGTSCPRHWRTPRLGIFPAREKVLGPAFLPAQALSGDKAGFGAKGPILPDGVKDVTPGSVLLQNLLPGWTELSAPAPGERSSEVAGPRGAVALGVTYFPVGSPSTPFPCPSCFCSAQECLGDHASVAAQQATGSRGIHLPFSASPLTLQPDLARAHLTLGTASPLPARGLPSPVPSLVSPISLAGHALQWVPLRPLE